MSIFQAFLAAKLGGKYPIAKFLQTRSFLMMSVFMGSGDSAVVGTAKVGTAKAA